MDAVEKRAAGEVLSARDEQRLRNHQLRMMRRQYLHDIVRFWIIFQDLTLSTRRSLLANHFMYRTRWCRVPESAPSWQISSTSCRPTCPVPWCQRTASGPTSQFSTLSCSTESECTTSWSGLWNFRTSNVPRLLAWSGFRFLTTFTVYLAPAFLVWTYMREQVLHGRWPTLGGFMVDVLTEHAQVCFLLVEFETNLASSSLPTPKFTPLTKLLPLDFEILNLVTIVSISGHCVKSQLLVWIPKPWLTHLALAWTGSTGNQSYLKITSWSMKAMATDLVKNARKV